MLGAIFTLFATFPSASTTACLVVLKLPPTGIIILKPSVVNEAKFAIPASVPVAVTFAFLRISFSLFVPFHPAMPYFPDASSVMSEIVSISLT